MAILLGFCRGTKQMRYLIALSRKHFNLQISTQILFESFSQQEKTVFVKSSDRLFFNEIKMKLFFNYDLSVFVCLV
jgi:hypothetical protein